MPQQRFAGIVLVASIVSVSILLLCGGLLFENKQNVLVAKRACICYEVGHALERYRQDHGRLPPATITGPNGEPFHSWRIVIQQYMNSHLFNSYDFSVPWHHEKNKRVLASWNPFSAEPTDNVNTDIFCVLGRNSLFEMCSKECFPDGGVHFLLLECRTMNIPWTEPTDLDLNDINKDLVKGGQFVFMVKREPFNGGAFRLIHSPDANSIRDAFRHARNELSIDDIFQYPP